MASINIPDKKPGDKLRASEVNQMLDALQQACTRQTMKTSEYFQLKTYDDGCFYVLTDDQGAVEYIYLGTLLFARRDKGSGSTGFDYTFPIVF